MALPRISYNSKNINLPEDVSMRVADPIVRAIRNVTITGKLETLVQKTDVVGEIIWEMVSTSGASDDTVRRHFRQLSTWAQEGKLFNIARDSGETANTTLSVAAAAGAASVTVTSAAALTEGLQYIIRDKTHVELVQIAAGGISGNVITHEETLNFAFGVGARYRSAEYWPARLRDELKRDIVIENPPLHFDVVLPFVEDVNDL